MTIRGTWNGEVLAQSDQTVVVEGNHYFPEADVRAEYLEPSQAHSTCPWKGEAGYRSVVVDSRDNDDAAWLYPEPKGAAREILDHVAFWKGVEVAEVT